MDYHGRIENNLLNITWELSWNITTKFQFRYFNDKAKIGAFHEFSNKYRVDRKKTSQ